MEMESIMFCLLLLDYYFHYWISCVCKLSNSLLASQVLNVIPYVSQHQSNIRITCIMVLVLFLVYSLIFKCLHYFAVFVSCSSQPLLF